LLHFDINVYHYTLLKLLFYREPLLTGSLWGVNKENISLAKSYGPKSKAACYGGTWLLHEGWLSEREA
jgi:hypothetical protein